MSINIRDTFIHIGFIFRRENNMTKLQTDAQVDKSPEHVAALLCSEDFLVAVDKQRDEVVDAVYRLIE
jgi:alpha-tubulin suppressor-like RCC1 family protein